MIRLRQVKPDETCFTSLKSASSLVGAGKGKAPWGRGWGRRRCVKEKKKTKRRYSHLALRRGAIKQYKRNPLFITETQDDFFCFNISCQESIGS